MADTFAGWAGIIVAIEWAPVVRSAPASWDIGQSWKRADTELFFLYLPLPSLPFVLFTRFESFLLLCICMSWLLWKLLIFYQNTNYCKWQLNKGIHNGNWCAHQCMQISGQMLKKENNMWTILWPVLHDKDSPIWILILYLLTLLKYLIWFRLFIRMHLKRMQNTKMIA